MYSIKISPTKFEIKVILAVFAIISGLIGFIFISGLVQKGSVDSIDMKILISIRNADDLTRPPGPKWLFELMSDITALGGATVVFLITLIVMGYFILQKEYNILFLILAAVIGGAIMDLELKQLFGRIRPELVPTITPTKSFSFPSGHSMMSAIIYLSLASLVARAQKRWRDKVYVVSVAIFLSFIIGISRIYLGVHYPTDVFGGWSLGVAWAAFCWLAGWYFGERKIIKKSKDH
jgi:undecaprenyl-diphosphatase